MPSQPSRHAPGEPGKQKMKVSAGKSCRGAALDRRGADSGVAQHVKGDREAVPCACEQRLDRNPAVTSRPVETGARRWVMITSTPGSAIQLFTWLRIKSTSSVTMLRAAR